MGPDHHLSDKSSTPLGPRKPRFSLTQFNDIGLSTERRDLVKGLIPKVGLTVVYGAPKTGKSYWIFDLMMNVALGRDYRTKRVHQGAVVYCALEGQMGFEGRAAAYRRRFLSDDIKDVPFYLQSAPLDLVRDSPALIAAIKDQLGAEIPVAVVLDTLNRSLKGSESSDLDMSAYVRAADAIRDAFQCAVVVVHHSGNDPTRPRGHTALAGAVDAQLKVTRDRAGNILVEVELRKDGPVGAVIASTLEVVEVGTDEDGEVITSCVVVPVEATAGTSWVQVRRKKQTNADRIALRALDHSLDEFGAPAVHALQLPEGTTVVKLETWRAEAFARGISPAGTTDAQRIAFDRAVKRLIACGEVDRDDEFVWLRSR